MQDNEALLRLKQLLNETQALARVGSFEWDIQQGTLTWSDQMFEIFGVDRRRFFPSLEAHMSLVAPGQRVAFMQSLYKALETLGQFEAVQSIVRADKARRVISSRGRVIVDQDNLPARLIGACMDITEQAQALEELRASQDRYRALVDHASDSLILYNERGEIIDVNTRTCSLLGYTREELIGQKPMLYNREMTESQLRELIQNLHTQEQVSFEGQHTDRQGRVFPVEVRLRSFSENGQARAVALALDISERRRAEAARIANEQRLQRIGDNLPNGALVSFLTDQQTRITIDHASAGFWPMLGYQAGPYPDNLSPVIECLPRKQLVKLRRALRTNASGRQALDERFLVPGRDGSDRWLHARCVPTIIDNYTTRWDGVVLDVTEQWRTARDLEDSQQRLGLLVDSANLVLWEADPISFQFTYVSDCCERLLGFSREAWLEPDFWVKHLHPDDATEAVEICKHSAQAGVDHRMEYRMLAADGRVVWIEDAVHMNVIDGQIVGMQGVIQDISQRKLLEDQLRQSQKMEAIGRLAGGIAHDFNNILTVMMGYAELLLLNMPASDPSHAAVNAINDAGKRASGLTRQLLTFSRKAIVAPKVLDLNELVRSTEALLRPTIGEDIKLTIDIDPHIRPIKADRVHIEQVIMNLAINARDAMPQGGSMIIATRDRVSVKGSAHASLEDYVELSLTDSGCGISEDVLGKIFDPFFTTKEVGRGTGLGLSVVHGVVTGAGGFIEVESQVGYGTTFHLCFPAAAPANSPVPDRHQHLTPRGDETILLVEDDKAVRGVTLATLVQQGYRVVDASHGEQALELFRQSPESFDLLLTDVVMPGMSGRQLAEMVRLIRADLPVMFMSGHTDDAVIQHGISSQADAFIQKPFHPHSLGRKIRELLAG